MWGLGCNLSAVCDLGRAAVHPAAHTQRLLPRALSRHPGWYAACYSLPAIAHAAVWSTPILWRWPVCAGFRSKWGELQGNDIPHDMSAKCTSCLLEFVLCPGTRQVVWIKISAFGIQHCWTEYSCILLTSGGLPGAAPDHVT